MEQENEQKPDEKILEFYTACTDLRNAKLILADAKIGKILKAITSSPELFATVGECLVNFNFETEFRKAQVKKDSVNLYFALPSDRSKLVALVFSILSACDNHQLDLHAFIRDFFVSDNEDMAYGFMNFVYKVVYPFRNVLSAMVGFGDDEQQPKQEEDSCDVCEDGECDEEGDLLGDFFSDVSTILSRIKEVVKDDLKTKQDRKDEIFITIDALFQSIDLGNLKIMNALLISLYYLLAPVKSVRFYKTELEERFAKFYSQLEN